MKMDQNRWSESRSSSLAFFFEAFAEKSSYFFSLIAHRIEQVSIHDTAGSVLGINGNDCGATHQFGVWPEPLSAVKANVVCEGLNVEEGQDPVGIGYCAELRP